MAIASTFAIQFAQDACATLTALRPLFPPTSVPSTTPPHGSAKSLPMRHSGFANARGRDKQRGALLLVRRAMGSERKASFAVAPALLNSMSALLVSDAPRLRELLGVGHVSASALPNSMSGLLASDAPRVPQLLGVSHVSVSTRPTAARPNPSVNRTPGKRRFACLPVPSRLRRSVAGYLER